MDIICMGWCVLPVKKHEGVYRPLSQSRLPKGSMHVQVSLGVGKVCPLERFPMEINGHVSHLSWLRPHLVVEFPPGGTAA